ncbi:MAG TPA: glycosyltransferase family 9 protein, partial [Verrucomicrobiae bacterium]|nr:glycosyltransferase family 9 protein [Verrucomicrobiae bacterium]
GDALMMIPALQAIRRRYPGCALHVLAPESVGPLLQNEPSITRLWLIPRVRGRALFKQSWPVIRALRAERFDRSIDFGGNDRGAIMSFLCGARERLAPFYEKGFVGRRFCHTRYVPPQIREDCHEAQRLLDFLSPWDITSPPESDINIELHTSPEWDAAAEKILPDETILCHIGSSVQKKEWPVRHWSAFYRMATSAGYKLIFNTGSNPREMALLQELKNLVPEIIALPPLDLATLLAVIKRARACVSNDTGPMHFAAGLGVPTIGLFGFTPPVRWRPVGARHRVIQSPKCTCDNLSHFCKSSPHCMAGIKPEEVFAALQALLHDGHAVQTP